MDSKSNQSFKYSNQYNNYQQDSNFSTIVNPVNPVNTYHRTSVKSVVSPITSPIVSSFPTKRRYHSKENFTPINSQQNYSIYKKVVISSLLTLMAILVFSSSAYSITDHIAIGLNVDLFGKDGEPSISAIGIHAVMFMIISFTIISIFKNW